MMVIQDSTQEQIVEGGEATESEISSENVSIDAKLDSSVGDTSAILQKFVISMASDIDGHFIGIVTDHVGATPVADAKVTISGQSVTGAWKECVHTNDMGLFCAPMPLGLKGVVTVEAELLDSEVLVREVLHLDATDFQYGFTPIGVTGKTSSLGTGWKFQADPPEDFWMVSFDDTGWSDIKVPAHWEMEGFKSFEGVGGYRKHFLLPSGDGRLKLRFDGVYSGAEVWVNGCRMRYHEGGATPFEIDVTDVACEGDNLIAVKVTENTITSTKFDKMSYYAGFALAGIMRAAYMFRVPEIHVGALSVITEFDADYVDAVLLGKVAIVNESSEDWKNAYVCIRLSDPLGNSVQVDTEPSKVDVNAWQRVDKEFTVPVAKPEKWSAEDPKLYLLTVELLKDEVIVQRLQQCIGFRQINIMGTEILVNGMPVKFRGVCHHEQHPLMGRAVTPEFTRFDLGLIKEANLNAIRTSHYTPIPELLDITDSIGIYVESEAPLCWVEGADDLRLTPYIIQLAAEMLARDRNHPSIFSWSLSNESLNGYGLQRAYEWVKSVDPSRPAFFSGGTSVGDVRTRHNPITLGAIDRYETSNLPVIWDESFAVFQGIFGDVAELWVDPGMRDYYVKPFISVYGRFIRSKTVCGSMIWAWADDLFCVPNRGLEYGRVTPFAHVVENQYLVEGRGIVGDAPWGLVDGWRRRKPEFWLIKKLHSPVKIDEQVIPVPDYGNPVLVPVENFYDFTDLSELEIRWELAGENGALRASVPPRTRGEFSLDIRPRCGDTLKLDFIDRNGLLVDTYFLSMGKKIIEKPNFRSPRGMPLKIVDENTMSSYGTRIVGREFELSLNRGAWGMGNGYLHRSVAFSAPMLLEYPTLHVMTLHSPFSLLPDRVSWKMSDMSVDTKGEEVRVILKGAYAQFEGCYEWLVTPDGEMTVRSSFTYLGAEVYVREMGLRISVSRNCDVLAWDRNAEWSVYPDDHIGRSKGIVSAFPQHTQKVPPECTWSQDHSPMGCSDFRSTKRNINWVSITYPSGKGILVESNGRQHARAIVETDRISLHINDFYGGTNVGRWRPSDLRCFSDNYGTGKLIRNGDRLETVIHLRFAYFEGMDSMW